MNKKWERPLDNWIFNSYPVYPEALGLCRIFYAAYMLFYAAARIDWMANYPAVFFDPPLSIARLFSGFPPLYVLHGFNVLSIILWILLLVGYRTKIVSITLSLFMIVVTTFLFSFGKINHIILLTSLPFVMAFANWGAAFSIDAHLSKQPIKVKSWPLTFMSIIIGFGMFTAGVMKLPDWLYLDTLAVKSKVIYNYVVAHRTGLLSSYFVALDNRFFWEFLDWATIILEVGFLFAIFKASVFRLWVAIAVVFHFSVLVMINIDFSINLLAYSIFLPWLSIKQLGGKKLASFFKKINQFFERIKWWHIGLLFAALLWILYRYGSVYKMLLNLGNSEESHLFSLTLFVISLSICAFFTIYNLRLLKKRLYPS